MQPTEEAAIDARCNSGLGDGAGIVVKSFALGESVLDCCERYSYRAHFRACMYVLDGLPCRRLFGAFSSAGLLLFLLFKAHSALPLINIIFTFTYRHQVKRRLAEYISSPDPPPSDSAS